MKRFIDNELFEYLVIGGETFIGGGLIEEGVTEYYLELGPKVDKIEFDDIRVFNSLYHQPKEA